MRSIIVGMGMCLAAAAAQAGELAGRVSDASGESPLQGARVQIVELNREAISERDGRYRITNVPAGSYTVRAEYVGADDAQATVTVTETGSSALDLRLGREVTQLENVLVVGLAAGQSSALSQQRAASNIKNVVSADAIGRFPDQNAAESLQRIPGVSLARDQGEGRFAIIRGIDPALSSTTVNGIRVPGPESDSRQVNLDVIASDLLETLEVTKTMTPDMDGDAVGGNIEIKSATAFDRGNSISARAEGSYNELVGEWSPKLALSATRLFEVGGIADRLGVAAALSWFSRDFGSDNVETAGWPDIEGPDGEEFRGLEEAEQRDYLIIRERLSAALNFDYRATQNLDLYWRTLYSEFSDDEVQTTNLYVFEDGEIAELSDAGARWTDATVEKLTEARKETQTIFSTALGAEQRSGRWTLNYTLGYASAEEDNPDALGATFVGEGLAVGYDASNRRIPRLFAEDASFAEADSFALDEIVAERSSTQETETSLALDVRRDLQFGAAPGFLKFGGKARLRDKDGNLDAQVFDGFDQDYTMADFAATRIDYPLGVFGPAASRSGVRRFFSDNRDGLELDEDGSAIDSQIEDYDLSEDIYAAYLMASADVGRLRLVGGLRVERTEYSARGTQFLLDEEGGSGDPEFASLRRERDYTDVLPSLNLRYSLNERLLLRAAYSMTIARPSFEQASPRQAIEIEEDDGEFERVAEFGNPDLDPLRSQNFDLAIEFYPGGVTALSAGLFYKRIDDFFVIADVAGEPGPFEDFDEAITTLNGGSADLYGLELSLTHKFKTLPAPFDGLLIGANATFTDSEAELPQRDDKAPLPRQSDLLWNLLLGYEKKALRLRLAATYRDAYFDEIDELDDPSTDRYVDDHLQIDFSGSYRVAPNYEIYVNAVNLNDEPFYAYFGNERFSSQYEEYGPTYEIGVKADF